MNNQEFLNNRFEELIKFFQTNSAEKTDSVNSILNKEYFPEYYGGAHLTNDNNLEIQIVNNEKIDFLRNHFSSNMVNFNYVEHSLFDLLEIYRLSTKLSSKIKGVSISVNQLKNRIDVTVSCEEDLIALKHILSTNNIDLEYFYFSIEEVSSFLASTQVARSGNCIATPSFTNSEGENIQTISTILCNVYNSSNNYYGVITCDHIFDEYGRRDYLYLADSNTVIGGVKKFIRDDRGTLPYGQRELDCVLVGFSSPNIWSPNDRVYNYLNQTIPGVITSLGGVVSALEGSSIRKYGIASGREDGTIVSSYYSIDGFVNQMLCSAIVKGGDSGGPIGKWTSASPNRMTLYGMTRAGINSGTYKNYTVASKAASVLSGLGVSLYVKN